MTTSVHDFGLDLWIELIISNDISNQDIFNLCITCKFLSQLFRNAKIVQFIEERQIHFGTYSSLKLSFYRVAWSHDSQILASGEQELGIFIWETRTGKAQKILKYDSKVHRLLFHPHDPNLLVAAYYSGSLSLWDICQSKVKTNFTDATQANTFLAFHPDGRFLASGGREKCVQIWNVANGKLERNLSVPDKLIPCIAFSSDGNFLAASNTSSILIWNFETFQLCQNIVREEDSSSPSVWTNIFFKFFDDNKTIVSMNYFNSCVKFYDITSGNEKTEMSFESEMYSHNHIILHPNQKMIAFAGHSGFEIWEIVPKKLLRKETKLVLDLSQSPNGRALAGAFGVLDVKKYL